MDRTVRIDQPLHCNESCWLDDWWCIEDSYGRRIAGGSDVEGTGEEMRAIAEAVTQRRSVSFKRCAVRVDGNEVAFWSPRNSMVAAVVTLDVADELARDIRRLVTPKAVESKGEVG